MSTHIATALDTVPDAAIDALSLRLEDRAPVLILAFASPKHPLDVVLNRLSTRFPTAEVLGASSAGDSTSSAKRRGLCRCSRSQATSR